jgi:hypothetical protein
MVRDELVKEIQAVLPKGRTGLQPMQLSFKGRPGGRSLRRKTLSHWWLESDQGRVIDLTVERLSDARFPYHKGRRRGFMYERRGPSKRAKEIIRRVKEARG